MAQSYELYGTKILAMPQLKDLVGDALGIAFALHDSAFRGGDYFRSIGSGGDEFVIQRNMFELDGEDEIAEREFAYYPVIFWIAWTERGDEFRDKLAVVDGLDFLRRHIR